MPDDAAPDDPGSDSPAPDDTAATVACSWCGTRATPPPVTWTVQTGPRGLEYLCERCTRDNVRKIEGSLPTDYW